MTFRVLIVDDEPDNLRILSSLLRDEYQVFIAKSGEQALSLASSQVPDLILLDVMMPKITGFDVIQQLKNDQTTKDIPVIFITGLQSSKDETTGFELGAVDYIHKPFNSAVVSARVSSQLKIVQQRHELQQLSEQLQKASEAKGMFLANMSHEIRTPLTTVIGYSDSLMTDSFDEMEKPQAFAIINNSSKHLLSLVNNILDFSKIEAGEISIEILKVDLHNMLQEVHIMCNDIAKQKDLGLVWKLETPIPSHINTDPTRLKQILLNIIANAIKFTEAGEITVSLELNQQQLNIAVHDQGIGIPKDKLDNLFTSFNQVDNSTTRKFGGTGLGLSISQSLAAKLGGEITVKSKLNLGSTFTLSLPVEPESENEYIEQLNISETFFYHEQLKTRFDAKVLLAEDHNENRQLFTFILNSFGLDVDAVENGKQAVQACMDNSYDLILMDIQMPIMTGIEAQKLIRSCGLDLPIIALTANVMKEEVESYLNAGFDDHISKPLDKKQLVEKLMHYCSKVSQENDTPDVPQDVFDDLKLKFQKSFPEYKQKLEQELENRNYAEIAQLAHKFNGAARSFDFENEGSIAEALEKYIYQTQSRVNKTTLALIDKLESNIQKLEK